MFADAVFGVAGHKDDPGIGPGLQRSFDPARPVKTRHDHVGDKDIHRQCFIFEQRQSFFRGARFQHRVTVQFECARGKGADGRLVFNQKDHPAFSQSRRCVRRLCWWDFGVCGGCVGRQKDCELRSCAERAFGKDKACLLYTSDAADE